jgi:hypothetical protein
MWGAVDDRRQPRHRLAALDLATGAADASLNIPFTGNPIGGSSRDLEVRHHPERQRRRRDRQLDTAGGQLAPRSLTWTNHEPGDLSSWSNRSVPLLRHERRAAEDLVCRRVPALHPRRPRHDGTYVAVVTTGGNNPNRSVDCSAGNSAARTGQTPRGPLDGRRQLHSVLATARRYGAGTRVNNPYNPAAACTGLFG